MSSDPKHCPLARTSISGDDDDEASLDIRACSLCHCCLDYSDRAAFFREDRFADYETEEDAGDDSSFVYRRNDPYIPETLEDPNDALLYCDSCPRLFHQKCHFVPVLTFHQSKPWHCLICLVQKQQGSTAKNNGTTKGSSYPYDIMFQSPPVESGKPHELRWERDPVVIGTKYSVLSTQLNTSFPRAFSTPLSNYKQAMAALQTIGHSQRNKHKLPLLSQQLIQSISSVTTAKQRIRSLIMSLEGVRSAHILRRRWDELLEYALTDSDFVTRVVFPFGLQHKRRWAPVSPEYQPAATATNGVPTEIVLHDSATTSTRRTRHTPTRASHPPPPPKNERKDDDDDASFSLDQLQCSICLGGESSDDNDMILCDGKGCFRACHTQCVQAFTIDENADWFCPFCVCLSKTMARLQEETAVDVDGDGDDNGSWDGPQDVFPEAKWEASMASRLKVGERGPDSDRLIKGFLGIEDDGYAGNGDFDDDDDDDDDDEEEDGHFDLDSYEEDRRLDRQSQAGSSHSSKATLGELSSVELSIGGEELKALKAEGEADTVSGRRRSKRGVLKEHKNPDRPDDPGKMDPSNIVEGKRKRKRVDYRRLNDSIFGDATEEVVKGLDDKEDFHHPHEDEQSDDGSSVSD